MILFSQTTDTKTTICKAWKVWNQKETLSVEKEMGATPQNTQHSAVNSDRPSENHTVWILFQGPSQDSVINSNFHRTLTVYWVSYWALFLHSFIYPNHDPFYRGKKLRGFNLPEATQVVSGRTGSLMESHVASEPSMSTVHYAISLAVVSHWRILWCYNFRPCWRVL